MTTVYCTVNGITRSSTEKAIQTPPAGGSPAKVLAEYEASSLATASTIHIATVPAYSRYRIRQINHDALGTGTSIQAGHAGDTDEQISDTATVAAGTIGASGLGWKQTDSDLDLTATTTGTMTGTIQFEVEYYRQGMALTL